MSDERRKRAAELIAACWCYPDTSHKQMDSILAYHAIDAMLAFAAEEVAKERARCVKVCFGQKRGGIDVLEHDLACNQCAEAILKARDGV